MDKIDKKTLLNIEKIIKDFYYIKVRTKDELIDLLIGFFECKNETFPINFVSEERNYTIFYNQSKLITHKDFRNSEYKIDLTEESNTCHIQLTRNSINLYSEKYNF